ncbi:MAG: hypothetical protein CVU48_05245 [Candidatus Cloacimonetes bacterium HGW-Cloacimonetes-1]|nr:MAG: hypothetical protein CVU48_05245 [Candidatus Cloacimonetes bacterium HGW-Cloacimonetes-1]
MDKLHIFVCKNIAPELVYLVQKNAYTDVSIEVMDTDCSKALLGTDELIKAVSSVAHSENVRIIGSVCVRSAELELAGKFKLHNLENCFELFLNKGILNTYISQGYYLISSGWLQHCWETLDSWGFDETSIKEFFRESAQKLMYFDTGVMSDFEPELRKVSAYIGLEYEVLDVGIDFCEYFMKSMVSQWRYEKERLYLRTSLARLTRQTADYAMVFDQIASLTTLTSETQIVNSIMDLFNLLFSARTIVYVPYFGSQSGEPIVYRVSPVQQAGITKDDLDFENCGPNDLRINVRDKEKLLGIFKLMEISFPQYKDHYDQLAAFLSNICALGIANARKYLQLQENEIQLTELNEQKDKMFSVIAHDIKGPVGNFVGLTELMKSSVHNSDVVESDELAHMLHEESIRLNILIGNLLKWSAFQAGHTAFKPKSCNFHEVVLHVKGYIETQSSIKKVVFTAEYPPDLAVRADQHMLQTVLRNLLANAIKYTHEHGYVKLKAIPTADQMVQITVFDTGIGMPNTLREKLFMPGENVSRPGTKGERSTGLGLLICHDFIKKHGSLLEVESEEGEGTRFTFLLPLALESPVL